MSHNAEHAQRPQTGSPDPTTQRAPQTPPAETPHASREPGTNAGSPDHTPTSEILPQGERDKLTLRLRQALNTFVDRPRQAVEEADAVFDEVATQFTNSLKERRRVLHTSWQDQGTDAQTEQLRLALRQYREITERLLHMAAPASR
ncbi:hypothetical protein AB5J56_30430 [Streptomyces sp. R21]|uniref:Uncharacterized protein n=1 Tax=Streptomyces sp. R21 TaxID=3238627 RepID=A0AB39PE36_9ACTN